MSEELNNNILVENTTKKELSKEGVLWMINMLVGTFQYYHPELAQAGVQAAMLGGSVATAYNIASNTTIHQITNFFSSVKRFLVIESDQELIESVAERNGAGQLLADITKKAIDSDSVDKSNIYTSLFCRYLSEEGMSSAIIKEMVNRVSELSDVETHILYKAIINEFPVVETGCLIDLINNFAKSIGMYSDSSFPDQASRLFINRYLGKLISSGFITVRFIHSSSGNGEYLVVSSGVSVQEYISDLKIAFGNYQTGALAKGTTSIELINDGRILRNLCRKFLVSED